MIWRKSQWPCTLQPMVTRLRRASLVALLSLACAPPHPQPPRPAPAASANAAPSEAADTGLPPIPTVEGPLRVFVVYPSSTDIVDARDSTFLFGSVGTGSATLTANGTPVAVAPNGAWLAWLSLPQDSLAVVTLVARSPTDSQIVVDTVHRVPRYQPPALPVWIDSNSFSPQGPVWWPADEYLPISIRAVEGAEVRLLLPGGAIIPLVSQRVPDDIPDAIRAFDRDSNNLNPPLRADRYVGMLRGGSLGSDPGPVVGQTVGRSDGQLIGGSGGQTVRRSDGQLIGGSDSSCVSGRSGQASPPKSRPSPCPTVRPSDRLTVRPPVVPTIEVIRGPDTVRAQWHLQLALLDTIPALVTFDDDTGGHGTTDSLTIGRTRPGATYAWFFPTGTRTQVTGRLGTDLRVRLSRTQEVWVPVADAVPLTPGAPATRATIGSITLTPQSDRLVLRIPATWRVPFRVEEEAGRLSIRLYSALGDINWTRYGATDPYISDIRWLQATSDELLLTVDLHGPVWGYHARWSGNDLLLEIRRPPSIDAQHPLAGRRIVLDPGHPPLGATGPTGYTEAEANLAVALTLRQLLLAEGAEVIMTRTTAAPVELNARPRFADSVNAEILVSIHNNALPDGVNPWTNNGSSVFYNHPRSRPLAAAIQRRLVGRIGLRDLGVGRGDLALARPTWMPAVLCEGLFMMLPEQEAALRQPEGQRRYALSVRDGLADFLRGVARSAHDVP